MLQVSPICTDGGLQHGTTSITSVAKVPLVSMLFACCMQCQDQLVS